MTIINILKGHGIKKQNIFIFYSKKNTQKLVWFLRYNLKNSHIIVNFIKLVIILIGNILHCKPI